MPHYRVVGNKNYILNLFTKKNQSNEYNLEPEYQIHTSIPLGTMTFSNADSKAPNSWEAISNLNYYFIDFWSHFVGKGKFPPEYLLIVLRILEHGVSFDDASELSFGGDSTCHAYFKLHEPFQ
jgi:hypothetical protein